MPDHVSAHLIETIEVSNELGGGVLWRAEDQTVWWTDINGCQIYKMSWPESYPVMFPAPYRIGSFTFIQNDLDKLLVAFENGIAYFNFY